MNQDGSNDPLFAKLARLRAEQDELRAELKAEKAALVDRMKAVDAALDHLDGRVGTKHRSADDAGAITDDDVDASESIYDLVVRVLRESDGPLPTRAIMAAVQEYRPNAATSSIYSAVSRLATEEGSMIKRTGSSPNYLYTLSRKARVAE